MYNSAINQYGLSDSGEYLINVEDIPETPNHIKAYIPKLMPYINIGNSAINNMKVTVNSSIFINASDCKISGISPVANTQNYVTVKPYPNQSPNFRSKAINISGKYEEPVYIVPKHNKFLLELLHGDIGHMYFTEKM